MQNLQFFIQNFRWILAGALLAFSSSYGQTFFISLFAADIQREFGLTHGEWGSLYMVGTLCSAFLLLYAGGLSDQFRARSLSAIVLLCLAVTCLFVSWNEGVIGLFAAVFALRFFGQGMMSHLAKVSMSRWFVASRGKALAMSSMGISIGEAILPIAYVGLMALVGWRTSWIFAAFITVATIPIIFALLKDERTPQNVAKENVSLGMKNRHWTRKQVLRHWMFWLVLPSVSALPTFATALFFHQVHFATSKGWSHFDFVSLFPIYTTATITMTFLSGFLVDRVKASLLLPFFTIPAAIAFMIFWQVETLFGASFGFILFSMMTGTAVTVIPACWAEFYGTQHLGSIKALATVIMVTGSAIGPGLTGWLIDHGVDFAQQMPAFSGFLILCSLLSLLALVLRWREEASTKIAHP